MQEIEHKQATKGGVDTVLRRAIDKKISVYKLYVFMLIFSVDEARNTFQAVFIYNVLASKSIAEEEEGNRGGLKASVGQLAL